jgi:hypothetical protein
MFCLKDLCKILPVEKSSGVEKYGQYILRNACYMLVTFFDPEDGGDSFLPNVCRL